jgi:hypothetical protein
LHHIVPGCFCIRFCNLLPSHATLECPLQVLARSA